MEPKFAPAGRTEGLMRLLSGCQDLGSPGGSDGNASARNAGDTVRSLGWEDSLEKEMTTHSSILARKIPMDRGQSMGSQRVGHD